VEVDHDIHILANGGVQGFHHSLGRSVSGDPAQRLRGRCEQSTALERGDEIVGEADDFQV
jgi:hypothetical protein